MKTACMSIHELDFAVKLACSEGWKSEHRDVFEAFFAHDPAGCFVGFVEDKPVGMCIATGYMQAGYIGELIVKKPHRGKGFGRRLLETGLGYLHGRGHKTVYLDAIPAAVPLYEKFGFQKICRSLRFQGRPDGRLSARVRPIRKWDLEPIFRLDKIHFGEDRHFFLKWKTVIGPDFSKALIMDGQIRGYITGRYASDGISVGPWVTDESVSNPECLLLALAEEAPKAPLNLGVLETSPKSIRILKSLGFSEKTPDPPWRMVLGPDMHIGASAQCLAIGHPGKG